MTEEEKSDLEYFDKQIKLLLKRKQYKLLKRKLKQREVFYQTIKVPGTI